MSSTPRFIGIDPNTGTGGSPTVWADEAKQEIIIQGWDPDAELTEFCAAFTVPNHAVGIPEGESVVRVPARLIPILREACNVFDNRAEL